MNIKLQTLFQGKAPKGMETEYRFPLRKVRDNFYKVNPEDRTTVVYTEKNTPLLLIADHQELDWADVMYLVNLKSGDWYTVEESYDDEDDDSEPMTLQAVLMTMFDEEEQAKVKFNLGFNFKA